VYNPNKIILKSCQTNKNILKKLPMDFSGSFNLKIKEKNILLDKLFVYYLMEVKNNFPLENRITIEIDSSFNFDQMIIMSKQIREDYESLFRLKYGIKHLPEVFNKTKEILTSKMLEFAENDEFEKAARVKMDITYVNDKIVKLKDISKDFMPYYQFIKTFHIN
jgi:hypothetical protein